MYETMNIWHFNYCVKKMNVFKYCLLWHDGVMIRWRYDRWRYDTMALWYDGVMIRWRYDTMALWYDGAMIRWRYDTMPLWYDGVMIWWRYDMMALWYDVPFYCLAPKNTVKLFSFPFFDFPAYMMKIISETRRVY
jgi:hypothetical protein